MQKQRIVVLVGGSAGALATFLPWISVPLLGSVAGTAGDGWISLGVCALAMLFTIGRGPIGIVARVAIVIAGLCASGIAAWDIWHVIEAKASMTDEAGGFGGALARGVDVGPGLYLLGVAGLIVVAGALVPADVLLQTPGALAETNRGKAPLSAYDRVMVFLLLVMAGAAVVYGLKWAEKKGEHRRATAKPVSTCGDTRGLQLCVERAEQRYALANTFESTNAADGSAFLLVEVSVQNSTNEAPSSFEFELRDEQGQRWKPDLSTDFAAHMAGFESFGEDGGWLSFNLPSSAIPNVFLRYKSRRGGINLLLPERCAARCTANGRAGVCIDARECTGMLYPGLCQGGGNVQCCIQ